MSTPWSRRAPWPYDCQIDVGDGTGFHGLMLKPTQAGLLVSRETDFLGDVAPTTYEYGAARPDEETTFAFGRLTGGMGEKIQSGATSTRYRYATGVDCSIGGLPRLGPAFTAETFPALPAGTRVVRQFVNTTVAVPGPTADTVFALVDTYVYRRTAGAWALSKDFSATAVFPRQAVEFTGTGAASAGGLWVAGSGQLWYFNSVGWTQAVLPATMAAWNVAAVRGQLWIADGGVYVAVCPATADPTVAASWGGRIQVGDARGSITWLAAIDDVMYVFKTDGVYTVNADGSVNELFPELRPQRATTNGVNATAWDDHLYFPYGDGYYALDASGGLEPAGPERLVGNDSPVRGTPVSGASHTPWFHYLAVYNAATGASHLLKKGTWLPDASDPGGASRFADAWHGAIASWAGKQVSRIDVVKLSAATNPVLWVGFTDGTVQWTTLPSATADPALDAACTFQTTGQLYWPLHDARFGADLKAVHGFTALGPAIDANRTVRQYWRVDLAGAYQQLSPDFTAAGQRVETPDLTSGGSRDGTVGLQLDAYTELRSTSSAATPVLEGMALHEAVRPAANKPTLRLSRSMVIRAGNRVVRKDGVVSRTTAEAALALLRAAAGAAGHVRLRLPEGTIGGFAAVEYAEALDPDRGRDGFETDVTARFVQFR